MNAWVNQFTGTFRQMVALEFHICYVCFLVCVMSLLCCQYLCFLVFYFMCFGVFIRRALLGKGIHLCLIILLRFTTPHDGG